MRAKIARLREKEVEMGSKGGGGGNGFHVKKQGDATVVLVGPPSAGKSTLINALTNAESKVAPYAFTTVTVIPGMLKYKEAYIQILDIPGLIEGASKGKGRGKEVLSVARGADLLLLMTDTSRLNIISKMTQELEDAGIRLNKSKPDVIVERKAEGGLDIASNIKQDLDKETIKEIAREYGIKNGTVTLKEKVSFESLFDAFSENRVYIPSLFVVNKVDEIKNASLSGDVIPISAEKGIGISFLIEEIWRALKFVTVYLIKPENKPDFSNPIVMKQSQSLKELAERIGSDFSAKQKTVRIWGAGARFPGQEVSFSTKVIDGMQIRFIQ
ncbi:MAG TPA: GTPase [Patescibacteria group bacterium]|nr:GTPase [Patescibacteria group bacterium]